MSKYDPASSSAGYRWYVVFSLAVVYAVNVMDRSLLSILQEPIKRELSLSDTQLGMLTGLVFAAFYATLAIPIARVADRTNRLYVLCTCLALWSAMTVGCGMATGFAMLVMFRMGVGVGEAGGYPPSASILSDYFAKDRRATALAIFGLGASLGQTLGLFSGGWLNSAVGWRHAFLIIGLFGLVLSPIILFTVREPKRGVADAPSGAAPGPGFLTVCKVLWNLKTIRFAFIANTCHGFLNYAFSSWSPSYFIRVFKMPTAEVGLALGTLAIISAVGTFSGGFIADRLARRDSRWFLWIVALAHLLIAPAVIAEFMAPTKGLALGLSAISFFLVSFYVGPIIATGQTLVQPQIRATTAAIMLMIFNIFGLGLGPLLVGMASDYFGKTLGMGVDGLRYAMSLAALIELVSAGFYFLAGRHFTKDMTRDRSLDYPITPRA